ncbi:MAG: recombination protein RecR [Vampirovibrionales bacterium]|nr:recombination protein RecR [Vampirovibrionales bacterium]
MSLYTLPLARLVETFQKLPGIGPKSAQRLAFHVLRQPMAEVRQFADALIEAKNAIGECGVCQNLSAQSPCEICVNAQRDAGIVAVVADPQDLLALERAGSFHGRYHVLHGLISPMDGVGPDDLKIRELLARLTPDTAGVAPVREIILALPPSIEGDATTLYLTRLIRPLAILLTRIAFGLPAGGELDYADPLTISRALEGRREVS